MVWISITPSSQSTSIRTSPGEIVAPSAETATPTVVLSPIGTATIPDFSRGFRPSVTCVTCHVPATVSLMTANRNGKKASSLPVSPGRGAGLPSKTKLRN